MQRFVVCVAALVITGIVDTGAQTKIVTAGDYAKVMKATAQAFGGVTNTMSAGLFEDAKGNLATTRAGFVAIESFWADRKRDDAVAIVKGVLMQLDELERLLAAPRRSATLAATKKIQGACAACHAAYREGDNQSGFRFKSGVL